MNPSEKVVPDPRDFMGSMIVRWRPLIASALIPLTGSALLAATPALAAERGVTIRAGDLLARPFIDAEKAGAVAANQPVTIEARQGGWVQVTAAGKTGWVRVLNLRLESAGGGAPGAKPAVADARPSAGNALSNPASLLRTGSSGRTVTTGVKGLDEEDINNASPDYTQLALLDGQAVDAATARAAAQAEKLTENKVDYLKKGKGKDK